MSNTKDARTVGVTPADFIQQIISGQILVPGVMPNVMAKTSVPDVTIKHEGTQIILPNINGKPMSYDEAIEWMNRKKAEDEAVTAIMHKFVCSPLDGLVAFHKALANIYGWTESVPVPGFFGDKPPTMVSVPIGPDKTMQVPFGRMNVPGISGFLATGFDQGPPRFILGGEIKKRNTKEVERIATEMNRILKEESIYKGKAVKVSFHDDDDKKGYDVLSDAPQFMDLQGVNESDLIFGKKVMDALDVGLFTPIEQPDACRKYKVPLKRGVLLYGPYGTGKTMTAYSAAIKAARNGWTFVYLDTVLDLHAGLEFAAHYAPAVLFAEDIDRVMTGDRSVKMDDILNTLDGVDTKGAEIITVFTTNHIENINPAVLRMGRLDVLVEVSPPDAEAVEKLVRLYARGLLEKHADLKSISEKLEGQIPAFIREVVERAKMAAIYRLKGADIEGRVLEADLLAAANAMEPHAALLKPTDMAKTNNPELFVRVPSNHPNSKNLIANISKVA